MSENNVKGKIKEIWKSHKNEVIVGCITGVAACALGYKFGKSGINQTANLLNEYGSEFASKITSMADISNHAITAVGTAVTTMKDVNLESLSEHFPNGLDPDMKVNGIAIFCSK